MSDVGERWRSYERIDLDDLKRLAEIAKQDRENFFGQYPEWAKLYQGSFLCVALCQGAALHFLNGKTGINDFDIYSFYASNPAKDWYAKRIKAYDFGDPKFGQTKDKPEYVGRRVDCLGRSISVKEDEHPESALQRYLREGKTATARLLAEKVVVLLEPNCGKVIWPKQD